MTRVSHFCKLSKYLIGKPSSFAHKETSLYCFSDDQHWCKLSVLTVSRNGVMLHFKDQVFPPNTEVEQRVCISLRDHQVATHCTLSRFNVVFTYCDHGNRPDTVTSGFPEVDLCFSNPIQKLYFKTQCKSENQIFRESKFLSLLLG